MKRICLYVAAFIFLITIIAHAANPYNPGHGVSGWQQVVNLFANGSCSGYLKSDGSCGTSATSVTGLNLGTNATLTVSNAVNAAITANFGSAAYTASTAYQPASVNLDKLAANNADSLTNFPILNQDTTGNAANANTLGGFSLGTGPNNVVQLDSSAKLPAVDGSQVTNLDVAHIANVTSWGSSTPSSGYPVINGTAGQVNAATWQLQGTANSTYDLDNMGSSAANITYADLMTGISNSTLKSGSYYRITDFATKHYMFDSAGVQYETNTGATEPLIVFATSTNTLDKQAYSAAHPKDIIYYDPDPNNWLTDLGFAQTGTIVPDFKGVIYFRHDTLQDNYMGYDFRNVKFRRWALEVSAWNGETTYAAGEYAYDDTGKLIYRSLQGSNLNHALSETSWWTPLVTLSGSAYLSTSPNADIVNNIPVNATAYQDYYTFASLNANATYTACVHNNHFDSYKVPLTMTTILSILSNNVFFLGEDSSNQVTTISSNNFRRLTFANTFVSSLTGTTAVSDNDFNVFCYNLVDEAGFSYNKLSNASVNTIAANFMYNIAETAFMGCIVAGGFTKTKITIASSLDFSAATLVYDATMDKEIFTIQGDVPKLKYFDSGGNHVIADPTD